MKQKYKKAMLMDIIIIFISIWLPSINVFAWSDNGGGRPSYTRAEINQLQADGKWNDKIVFNSISDSVIGDEKNFVGARECVLREDGRCNGTTESTVWNANEINVEDGKTYIVRAYVHNNNPNGYKGVAKDTKVAFNVPATTSKSVEVNGFITSSNATPSEYEDQVVFKSDIPFHLEYVYGSALLENKGIGKIGLTISDDIVRAKDGGTLIGYDSLNGEIPGCYGFDNFVTIHVKVVYDYDFTVEKQVRVVGAEDQTWKDAVDAKIGDKVEFLIQYKNTSDVPQTGVTIKDTLPSNLRFVPGSIYLKNATLKSYSRTDGDSLIANGLNIGNYGPGANAYIKFDAEVVDTGNLGPGTNAIINWVQAGVGSTTRQDGARAIVHKKDPTLEFMLKLFISLAVISLIAIFILIREIIRLKKAGASKDKK